MTPPAFAYAIEALSAQHNRSDFCCGFEALDRYLMEQAGQDMRRRVAAPFVLHDLDNRRITGYYTLASTAIQVEELPQKLARKLPKYPLVPATLLGRLAVDEHYQGQGLGTFLLLDALRRSLMSEIASMAVVVDAVNESAHTFYCYHQFIPFPQQPHRLYLPVATIARMFS